MEMEQETEARSAVQTLGFDSKVRTEICRIFQCTKMIWDKLQDAPAGFLERVDDIDANSLRETILGSSAGLRGSSEKITNLLNDYYSSRSNTSHLSRHLYPSGDSAGSPHNPWKTESGVTNTSRLSRHGDPSGDSAGSPHNPWKTESGVTNTSRLSRHRDPSGDPAGSPHNPSLTESGVTNTSRLSRHRDPSGDPAGSPHNPLLTESGVTNTSRLSRHRDPSGDPAGSPHNSSLTESGVTDGLPPNPVSLWLAFDSDVEAASGPVSSPVRFNQAAPNEGDGSADHDLSEQSVPKKLAKKRKFGPKYSLKQRGTGTHLGSYGLPEDGFRWRTHGQRDILGSKFPRSYYRCACRNNEKRCPATKRTHRSDEDPSIFDITYQGTHTCQPTTFKRQSTKEEPDIPSTLSVWKERRSGASDNESWPRASIITEELQLRTDVQCLGFSTWDDVFDLSRTLVLGDVTSSDDQLQFAFFHMEAMIRLFGCGLPYSQVSILLETRDLD